MSADTSSSTTKILVDGVEHDAPLGGRLLEFLRSIGTRVPHFCYHPGLPVAASCRQCQVETKGKASKPPGLLVACRESIVEGMEILTDSPAVLEARRAVIEFLLVNHPLDCPICDKAGECTLQDVAYTTGQAKGRTVEPRRELPKRRDLGDVIVLDNERCILCTRCVRFFDDVLEDPQLTVADRGDRSVLTTFVGEPLRGDYQGNIVDLCPVGALTLKKFRFDTRVWFLEKTNTVCGLCSRGCNIVAETRDRRVRRIRPRENPDVNGWWMCDEGRLTFEMFNRDETTDRLATPMLEVEPGRRERVTLEQAVAEASSVLRASEGPCLAFLSPFATIEEGEAFRSVAEALARARSGPLRYGFYRPDPSGTGDDFLRTEDPSPNCRGLAEVVGLEAITTEDLLGELHETEAVFLSGFGLDRSLPHSVKVTLKATRILAYHGYRQEGFGFARVAIPASNPLEKSGRWVNVDGSEQSLRAALVRPSTVPADLEVLHALETALGARLSGQQGSGHRGVRA